jgi:hypothetical protein
LLFDLLSRYEYGWDDLILQLLKKRSRLIKKRRRKINKGRGKGKEINILLKPKIVCMYVCMC